MEYKQKYNKLRINQNNIKAILYLCDRLYISITEIKNNLQLTITLTYDNDIIDKFCH